MRMRKKLRKKMINSFTVLKYCRYVKLLYNLILFIIIFIFYLLAVGIARCSRHSFGVLEFVLLCYKKN